MKKNRQGYLNLCMHLDGKENLYLQVPTFWDAVAGQWMAFIKTPKTQRLIQGEGKISGELENSFIANMSKLMHENEELEKEIFEMFMPESYWEG